MSITKTLAKKITDYSNQRSLGSRFRIKRISTILRIIEELSQEHDSINIIDIGGTEEYWGIVPQSFIDNKQINITIVNLPGNPLPVNRRSFKFVHSDGCDLTEFGTNSFHIAHSNSVIEHVGDWSRMTQFSAEVKRVALIYFVQTPNFWFPLEPHCMTPFFHWLPKSLRVWMVMRYSLGHWKRASSTDEAVEIVESARLLSRKKFRLLFSDAEILTERFLLLPKSFIAIRK